VRWLVFKGPVLAELAYPSPEMRPYGDLDILVHPLDLPAALEALQDAGAQLLDVNWPLIQAQCRGELTLLLAGGSYVDLHWHVVNERADRRVFRLDPATMLQRCTHHDVGGVRVPTLDPADTVLHLALHAARSGGHLLQWMVDLVFAMRWLHPGPRLLRERADQSGVNLPLAVMLARSWRTLGAPWPLQAIDELGADRTWRRFVGAADVVLPPGRPLDEGWTWQTILRATRGTTPASAAALATAFSRRLPSRSGDQGPDERTPEGVNPLHVANGTRADRRRYLADVATEWEHMHSARG
jgi:hypothetical protein